ncbi:hypothetical protein ACN6LF_000823 [[Kitasatospora] papulosa]|uniref:hypothetical protein n=1 Tax=Streptomyces TaxID=1883 RepID=UPI002E0F5F78|nr:hypothetical protein OG483_00100 [[Kitasatospora] papulosa]WSK32500.1 hypothetical protein OG483_33435 [[Kitasatospora] papulosa]
MQREVEALETAELQRLVLAAVDLYTDRDALALQIAREETAAPRVVRFPRWGTGSGGTSA